MENLFRKIMLPSVISSVVFLVIAVIMFIFPEVTLDIVAKIIGGMIIALGLIGMVQYIRNKEESSFKLNLLYVITTIILGIVVMFKYKFVSSIIIIVIGAWICLDSLIKLRMSILLKNIGAKSWKFNLLVSIILLLIGAFLICNPFETTITIIKILALCIATYSILDILQDCIIVKCIK